MDDFEDCPSADTVKRVVEVGLVDTRTWKALGDLPRATLAFRAVTIDKGADSKHN
jgi:hypothetical protein